MYPILLRLDGIRIYSYGLMVAIGILAGVYVLTRLSKREGIDPHTVTDLVFYTVLVAILGSRVGFILLEPSHYLSHPLEMVKIWDGGLVFSFGLVFGMSTLYLLSRKRGLGFLLTADLFAPPLALGQAIGRIGCFLAGCCYGRETDSWCAVRFQDPNSLAPIGVDLYPTQLFHSFANLVIFTILLILFKKRRYTGQVLGWYMILHPLQRLLIERYRGDFRGSFLGTQMTTTQFVSLMVLFAGVLLLFWLKKKASNT